MTATRARFNELITSRYNYVYLFASLCLLLHRNYIYFSLACFYFILSYLEWRGEIEKVLRTFHKIMTNEDFE